MEEKTQIVFFNEGSDTEVTVSLEFGNVMYAHQWAVAYRQEYHDIEIDKEGNDRFKTFYKWHNPEDRQTYDGYYTITKNC